MLRSVLAVAALVAVTGAVVAQSDPIETRRNIMKGVGAATRTGTQMVKGEISFDLAKAQEVLKTYAAAADGFHNHFPPTAKTGGQTTAAPAIWENQADFRARFDAWAKDIQAAAAQTKDLDSFRAAFGNVTKACSSCHNTYRIKT
ncbi:c-type cytochrome [Enterovirga aerilata]|uniref:Cytochrome c n=1 Tax=Enterovirga aerilata TaxID=2730920 RepID=A0A849I3F1_9HYPH|nr:cytochrome c [Enterovirga sp. DB1703]NNM71888.1 cytochrome c [Enterovirga sp. DB1703]